MNKSEFQSQPLVSIIFTSYNHIDFLREAMNGILQQTYQNIELIIVDDNSDDGSKDVLNAICKGLNVRLILRQENSGSYVHASNYGASFATGKYLLFAQCDDFALSNQVEKLVDSAKNNADCGVVFSASNLVDRSGNLISSDYLARELAFKKHLNKTNIFSGRLMEKLLFFSCVLPNLSAVLIDRDLFEKVGRLDAQYSVVADWDLWFKLCRETHFFYLREELNNFRQHDSTIRSKVKIKKQIEEISALFTYHLSKSNLPPMKIFAAKIRIGAVWFGYVRKEPDLMSEFVKPKNTVFSGIDFPLLLLFLGSVMFLKEHFVRK